MAAALDLIRRWERLQNERGMWSQHWEDLARVMLPRRMGFASATVDGDRRTDEIYDGTPMQGVRGLANAIGGLLRPLGQEWFDVGTAEGIEDNSEPASSWLYSAKLRMMAALDNPRSRFRQATAECDQDLVVFGTGVLFLGESTDLSRLLFRTLHLKNTTIGVSDDDEVDTVYRLHRFTARQAVQRFGEANIGERAREALRNDKPDEVVMHLHCVAPRAEGRRDATLARNMVYASTWIELDSKDIVSEGGFPEMPYIVPRWDTTSGEIYGRSPGMIALPDANTLQAMGETNLVAGQLAAEPPLFAPNDGVFDPVNMIPGGLSYYDMDTARELGRVPIVPLQTGTNLNISREMQQDTRDQIFAAFFRNVLNLPTEGPQMTATEVIERKEEFIREIGPVFGRLESDYTSPMIERAFGIMLRAGSFGPIPPDLQGANVVFQYESPVKRIRQQAQAAAARLAIEEMGVVAQVNPEILDRLDADAYAKFLAEARGLPQQLLRSDDDVARIRQQRAEQIRQQQEAAQLEQAANVGGQAAKAIKDLDGVAA